MQMLGSKNEGEGGGYSPKPSGNEPTGTSPFSEVTSNDAFDGYIPF